MTARNGITSRTRSRERHLGDLDHDEEQQAVGRRDQADHDVDDDHDAEMHQVDAERLGGREQHRHDDQEDRRAFEQAAEDQQEEVDDQQEGQRRKLVALQHAAERLGDVLDRDDVVEDQRAGDQHADRGASMRALSSSDAVEVAPADAAVEQRPRRAARRRRRPPPPRSAWSRRCRCRRAGPPASSAREAPRQVMRGSSRSGTGCSTGKFRRLAMNAISAICDDAHQQARDDAAEEQVADRGVGDQRVEHHRDRRRDDRARSPADAAVSAAAKLAVYLPSCVIIVCISLPVPAASAIAEPDMPAKMMLCTTLTWARPPRKRPTSALQKRSSRSVMLPMFMNSAARMNSGIASRM